MIHMILRGDFGNQLFQYALGRQLALRHNTDLVLNVSNRLSVRDWRGAKLINKLGYFNLKARYQYWPPWVTRLCHKLHLSNILNTGTYFSEKQWGFDPDVLTLPDDTYLFGYFQSEKYFVGISDFIRQELRQDIISTALPVRQVADKIEATEAVSIHVRRRDYLKSARHNVCTANYYVKAIDYIKLHLNSPHFFVFSDDIAWCKANLSIDHCDFVDISEPEEQPMIDFQLMGLCQHHIIANSSFSWWPAWLNDSSEKIVVTPDRWVNDEPLNSYALRDTIPPDWIRIAFS